MLSVKRMKFLDELLGPIVCFFLYWHNLVFNTFFGLRKREIPAIVRKILIIKFFGMGSIILAGGMLRSLRKRFPGVHTTILTFAGNKDICERINLIDEVITIKTKSLPSFLISLLQAISRIRREKYEISLDLEFFAKSSSIIQYLCATPIRVGYFLVQHGIILKMLWRGDLLTYNVYYNPHRHVSEVFSALAYALGAEPADLAPAEIALRKEDEIRLKATLAQQGITESDRFFCLNINASSLALERRWPMQNYAELIRQLEDKGYFIILTGEQDDTDYVRDFLIHNKFGSKVKDLSGKLDLGGLIALLKKARLLVTNDSGPLHLAVSIGTPTVSLFGPETPERFGASDSNKHKAFYVRIYCSPCLNVLNQKTAPCNGDNECMKRIPVNDVLKAVESFL